MSRLILLEWIIIVIALLSLWPVILGHNSLWYSIYLFVVMLALVWVTRNRVVRTREAAREAKLKRGDAAEKSPRRS